MTQQLVQKPGKIVMVTRDNLDEIVDMYVKSFLSMNDVWRGFNPTKEELVPFLRERLGFSVDRNLTYSYEVDGVNIGATVHYDAVDYLNLPHIETKCNLFLSLAKYAQELEGEIAAGNFKRGECIIGAYGVIDPEYAMKGLTIDFWYEGLVAIQKWGFKTYYSRASHPISLAILKKFGAVQVNSLEFREEDLKGCKLTLVKIDMTKPFPSLESIKQKRRRPNNPPVAKL